MQRLYKFIFLVFLSLYALSVVYITLICYAWYFLIRTHHSKDIAVGDFKMLDMLSIGLFFGFTYAVAQLLIIALLMYKAFRLKSRFTIKNIITVSSWFFIVTTVIHIIYGIQYINSGPWSLFLIRFKLLMQFDYFFWFPFPLAWLTLYIIFASRIPKTE